MFFAHVRNFGALFGIQPTPVTLGKVKTPLPKIGWNYTRYFEILQMPVPLYWIIAILPVSITVCIVFAHTVLRQDMMKLGEKPFDFFRYQPNVGKDNKARDRAKTTTRGVENGNTITERDKRQRQALQEGHMKLKKPLTDEEPDKDLRNAAPKTHPNAISYISPKNGATRQSKVYTFRGKKLRNLVEPNLSGKEGLREKTSDEATGDYLLPGANAISLLPTIEEPETGSIATRLRSRCDPSIYCLAEQTSPSHHSTKY